MTTPAAERTAPAPLPAGRTTTGDNGAGRDRARPTTRARHPTGRRSKQAARAGGRPADRAGAAPRRAKLQTGGDGRGRDGPSAPAERGTPQGRGSGGRRRRVGHRPVGQARRPTGRRFRRAATVKVGPGYGSRPGTAPHGAGVQAGGEGGGGGPAGRSGAALRGAKVKTGGDGAGRGGAKAIARAPGPTGPGLKRAATAGGGPAGRSGAAEQGGSGRGGQWGRDRRARAARAPGPAAPETAPPP